MKRVQNKQSTESSEHWIKITQLAKRYNCKWALLDNMFKRWWDCGVATPHHCVDI